MKINDQARRLSLASKVKPLIDLYKEEKTTRSLYYSVRKKYYEGDIKPKVEKGHELIYTQLCATIADKMSSYVGVNAPEVNFKSKDITAEEDNEGAQVAEKIWNDLAKANDFKKVFLDANKTAGWSGDGPIVKDKKNGLPNIYHANRPQNITIGWKSDNFEEIEFWSYDYGLSKLAARNMFKEEFAALYSDVELDALYTDHSDVYGQKSILRAKSQQNYVKITDFNTDVDIDEEVKAGDNLILINDIPYFHNPKEAKKLYWFVAQTWPNQATGVSYFETSAHLVTMLDKKLSEEADAVSQAVYHKFVTSDRAAKDIVTSLKPGKTQVIRLSDEQSKLDVLALNSNSYNSEPLIKNLINMIRTNSFLQEIGQDSVSPNISGKALAMIYQSVIQKAGDARIRWEPLLKSIVIDSLVDFCDANPGFRTVLFDGEVFKYDMEIVWPEVLESDKASKIVTVQSMRQGVTPLVSDYTARQMAGIADPVAEDRRVDQETEKKMVVAQAMQGTMMQPSQSEGPLLTESDNQAEAGVPSGPGMAGSAQNTMSPKGAQMQRLNNEGV